MQRVLRSGQGAPEAIAIVTRACAVHAQCCLAGTRGDSCRCTWGLEACETRRLGRSWPEKPGPCWDSRTDRTLSLAVGRRACSCESSMRSRARSLECDPPRAYTWAERAWHCMSVAAAAAWGGARPGAAPSQQVSSGESSRQVCAGVFSAPPMLRPSCRSEGQVPAEQEEVSWPLQHASGLQAGPTALGST